jgi:C-terminal processing protease CtpA/Prc
MKISFHCYLISILVILGASFAFFSPRQTMAEQEEQSTKEKQPDGQTDGATQQKQTIDEQVPELKPDLPKLGVPRPRSAPLPHRQLKGSVQHSEVMKSKGEQLQTKAKENGQFDNSTAQGKLDGRLGKELFKLKGRQIKGGLNQTTETGLGIIGLKFAIFFGRAPMIYQVFAGTPAAEAGLKPRDTIIAVDGIPTLGLAKNEVYNMIVGQPGTQVTISFNHRGNFQTSTMTRMDVNAITDPRVRRDYLSM